MNGVRPESDASLSPAAAHAHTPDDESLFEAIPDALLVCTPGGLIVDVNPAALRLFGYAAIGMRSLPVEQLITFTALSASSLPDDTAGAEREFRARGILVRSDGTTLHVDVRRTHVTYQGTPHILIMARDISAEVSAYQSLELRVAERTRELST